MQSTVAQLREDSPGTGPVDDLSQPEALRLAFQAFSDLSGRLSASYQVLEKRVYQLNREIEQANVQRLRELEAKGRIAGRLENLLQLLPGGVIVLNHQGRVCESNAAACEILGTSVSGKFWRDIIRDCFTPRSDDGHEISLRNGRRISLVTRSLNDEPGQIILLTDQTDTRELQQSLARHQRLSAMGKMVSSLAHQIRTPLSAAVLYADQLQHEIPPAQRAALGRKLSSRLNNMERQVRDMLLFARGETVLDAEIDIQTFFAGMKTAAEVLLRDTIRNCTWHNASASARILCNQEALTGAMLNLIENAVQAGGSTVRLRISAHIEQAEEDQSAQESLLCLCVSDDGPGIDDAILKKTVEPFFTTKAQGTGLGLAVAQVVAKTHNGRFFIDSSQARDRCGTRAGFILPLLHDEKHMAKSTW
ncbi:MAG: ATP-binding protein [Pseudomonadales bacterium]|nr:ATP-binding protein [Pseudomonadales bacterium]